MRSVMPEDEDHIIDKSREFFTIIPNIVYSLGLSPYDFILYATYKKIAGDGGKCTVTIPNLAKSCGISERQVQLSKKKLSSPFHLLDGGSLIRITEQKMNNGAYTSSKVEIENIWPNNFSYLGELRSRKQIKNNNGGEPRAPGVVHMVHQGGAPYAHKEEPMLKKKTTTPTPPKKNHPIPLPLKIGGGFFEFLNDIRLSDRDKERLSLLNRSLVEKSYIHCTNPNYRVSTSLYGAIMHFYENPEHIIPEDVRVTNSEKLKEDEQLEMEFKNKAITRYIMTHVFEDKDCNEIKKKTGRWPVESYNGLEFDGIKILFVDPSFKNKSIVGLLRLGYPIPEKLKVLK